jgi:hypothetical protein
MGANFRFFLTMFIITALLIGSGVNSHARRPFDGEDAKITETGHWEVEAGFEWVNQSQFPGSHKRWGAPLRLTRGLANQMDLALETAWMKVNPRGAIEQSGIEDSRLILKKSLLAANYHGNEQLSWFGEVKLPTGDEKKSFILGTGKTDYGIGLAWEGFADHVNYRMSGAYLISGDPDNIDLKNVFRYAFGLETEIEKNLTGLFELHGRSRQHETEETSTMTAMFGVRKKLSETRTADLGLSFGVTESAPDLTIRTGMLFKF